MIEPFEDYPASEELVYFLGQACQHQFEKEDARNKVEEAITALKRIGSVALRTRVQKLEEQFLEQLKREKDVHVILQKKTELKKQYEESIGRIEQQLDEYVRKREHHKRMIDTEEKVLAIRELQKRIERAEFLIAKARAKGHEEVAEALQERVKQLKHELQKM